MMSDIKMLSASDKTIDDNDLRCRDCPNEVKTDVVRCSVCNAPYHPSCAANQKKNNADGFIKCCGSQPSSPTPQRQCRNDLVNLLDVSMFSTMDDKFQKLFIMTDKILTSVKGQAVRMNDLESNLTDALKHVSDLGREVKAVRNDFTNLKYQISLSQYTIIPACLREIELRKSRKQNIIVHGMSESCESTNKENTDQKKVVAVLATLLPDVREHRIRILRLGKYSQAAVLPRPIRIVFESEEASSLVVQAIRTLRRTMTHENVPATLQGIAFSRDLTPHQLLELKSLQTQLKQRQERGETNLRIVYGHHFGEPIIFAMPRLKKEDDSDETSKNT